MPYRYRYAVSSCAEAGCPNVAVYRGRCREHQLPRGGQEGRPGPRAVARLRARVVSRDGERCRVCGARERLELHHVDGNPANNRLDNLVLVCFEHNPRGEAHQRLVAERRRLVDSRQLPLTLSALRANAARKSTGG